MTHTPGPWHVLDDDEFESVPFIPIETARPAGQPGTLICEVRGNGNDDDPDLGLNDEDRANARLIAVAPDLLEALRQVKGWMDARAFDAGSPREVNILGWVNSAIAKAEGR